MALFLNGCFGSIVLKNSKQTIFEPPDGVLYPLPDRRSWNMRDSGGSFFQDLNVGIKNRVFQHNRSVSGIGDRFQPARSGHRSEEHTSELQSLMRISYAVFCLKKKKPI